MTHQLPGLFVASRANQRASRGGGGAKVGGGRCESRFSRPGSQQLRLCLTEERGAGLGHRAPRSRQRTRPVRQTPGQVVCSIGRRARPGRGICSRELPRPLEQWGAGAAPGWGLGWNPHDGRGRQQRGCSSSALPQLPKKACSRPCGVCAAIPISEMGTRRRLLRAFGRDLPWPRRCARQDRRSRDPSRAEGANFLRGGDKLTCTLYPKRR